MQDCLMEDGLSVEGCELLVDGLVGGSACLAAVRGWALKKMDVAFDGSGAGFAGWRDDFVVAVDAAASRETLVDPFDDETLEIRWKAA